MGKTRDDGGKGPDPSPATAGSEADRLGSLQRRIRDAEQHPGAGTGGGGQPAKLPVGALALVGRIATELVAGVAFGGLAGWALDKWLGTTPAFMIGLLFLGAAAGTMNIWRMAAGHGLKAGYFDQGAEASDDGGNRKNRKAE